MRRLIVPAMLIVTGALAALALAAPASEAGGGGHGGCVPRDGTGDSVVIQNSCYTPAVLYVQPGATVSWTNEDGAGHNVMLFNGELLGEQDKFFQGNQYGLMQGESFSYMFDAPGLIPYYCSIHPSMIGVVAVGDPASQAFGAGLTVQTGKESPQAIAQPPGSSEGKGQVPAAGVSWGEAAVGLGLFGGLLVGLVAVGGGLRLQRRAR